MTTTYQAHLRETQARGRKADRLVGAALQAGATAEDAAVRDALVVASGVRGPSLTTWRLVIERLAAIPEPTPIDRLTADIYAAYAEIVSRGVADPIGPKFRICGGRT